MLTILFLVLMLGVFGKLIGFAFQASWGIMKVILTFVFFPVILIGLFAAGAVSIAIPILLIAGAVSLLSPAQ